MRIASIRAWRALVQVGGLWMYHAMHHVQMSMYLNQSMRARAACLRRKRQGVQFSFKHKK